MKKTLVNVVISLVIAIILGFGSYFILFNNMNTKTFEAKFNDGKTVETVEVKYNDKDIIKSIEMRTTFSAEQLGIPKNTPSKDAEKRVESLSKTVKENLEKYIQKVQ